MPWGRLDDKANGNPKLLALSDAAWRMWGCALIYCQSQLTDGFVPSDAIHTFGVKARNKDEVADELCQVKVPGRKPLWMKAAGGYVVNDYLDWNDSRESVVEKREKDRKRKGYKPDSARNGNGTKPESFCSTTTTSTTTKEQIPQPPSGALCPDDTAETAGEFLRQYPALYSKCRSGARYVVKEPRDFPVAVELVTNYGPLPRLLSMLEVFLLRKDTGEMGKPGSPRQFAHYAPDCDRLLRENGR
jgi:hypothetical protein